MVSGPDEDRTRSGGSKTDAGRQAPGPTEMRRGGPESPCRVTRTKLRGFEPLSHRNAPLTKHCASRTCDWWQCFACGQYGVPGTEKRKGRWLRTRGAKG